MISITPSITLYDSELEYQFLTSSGPGGQNVNKVATAVQLRFDAARSPLLSDEVRRRLAAFAGRRMTADGVLIIKAQRFRSEDRNREDATHRLIELVRKAAESPRRRRATVPSQASKDRRLEAKVRRGQTKRLRTPVKLSEE